MFTIADARRNDVLSTPRPSANMPSSQHQPGKLVGNDKLPEFQAETLPAGSAPASKTFQPDVNAASQDGTAPPVQRYYKDGVGEGETADAASTIQGATSAQVHQGLGKPVQGQSSKELRSEAQGGLGGPEGVGGSARQATVDPHLPEHKGQRALDKDEAVIGRSDVPSAEERIPQSAESVASERR